MKKVVGIGASVLDTLISCGKYPVEDKKVGAEGINLVGGGPVGNALVVLSKLGTGAEIIGNFASDGDGRILLSDYEKYGVKTENVKIVKGTDAFRSYIILAKDSKTRTCIYDRGNVPDSVSGVNLKAIDTADVLHLDGNFMQCAIYGAEYARSKKVSVSLDAGGLYEGIEKLLPLVDFLIPSAEFALKFSGKENIIDAIGYFKLKYNCKVIVVTDGSNGGYCLTEEGRIEKYHGFKVGAVDTNGAGDTFHGAFLHYYLNGKGVAESCKYASAVSAYKCMNLGVRNFELNEKIVEEFIAKNVYAD